MNKKIKMTLLSSLSLVPVAAVISCGTETVNKEIKDLHLGLEHNYVLLNTPKINASNKIGNLYNEEENKFQTVIDKVDSISAPDKIPVSKIGINIFKNINVFYNGNPVSFIGSNLVKISTPNDKWKINSIGVVTAMENNVDVDITISIGTISKTITLLQRSEIINQKLDNLDKLNSDKNISLASPWGTTTTIDYGTYSEIENTSALKIHTEDIEEISGGKKAYAKIDKIKNATYPIEFDSTVDYIAFKFFIPQNMINSIYWFRVYFDNGKDISLTPQNFVPSHAGWYVFNKPIDHSIFINETIKLNTIKVIQMNSTNQSLSGDIFLEGIYVSDKPITNI